MPDRKEIHEKVYKYFKGRDNLRNSLAIISIVITVMLVIGAAAVSFCDDPWKTRSFWGVMFTGIFQLVVSLLLKFLSPHELFTVAYQLDELSAKLENVEFAFSRAFKSKEKLQIFTDMSINVSKLPILSDPARSWPNSDTKWPDLCKPVETLFTPLTENISFLFDFDLFPVESYNFTIYLYEGEENKLHCVYRKRNFYEDFSHYPSRSWGIDDGGVIVSIFQKKQIVIESDISSGTSYFPKNQAQKSDHSRYVSFVGVPILDGTNINKGKSIGVICVSCSKKDHFTPQTGLGDLNSKLRTIQTVRILELLSALLSMALKGIIVKKG